MANTIKLGTDGNWAVKENNLLAYNDENNIFKPIDFDFTRDSGATRVNEQGLIENVPIGVPRIDFSDGKGSLLLEPLSRNLITYSEDFTNASWVEENSSITDNSIISPNGTLNADKLIESADVNFHRISYVASVSDATHSVSVFVKKAERNYFVIRTNISGTNVNTCFDLNDGSVVYDGHLSSSIFNYEDDWYRCVITQTSPIITTRTIGFLISDNVVTNNNIPSYQGDGTSGVYIWGAQLEQGSYATSYIPTSGATATRNAETASKSNISNLINSQEGVLYFETKGFIDVPTFSRYIQLSKNGETGFNNSLVIQHRNNGFLRIYANGTGTSDSHFNIDIDFTQNHKIAVLYKLNGYKLFIDGVAQSLYLTPTQTVFSGLDTLSFDYRGTYEWNGSIKDVRVYNKALTDQELISLTS